MASVRSGSDTSVNVRVNVNVPPASAFHEIGRSAEKAAQEMSRLFEASYEAKVDRIVEEASRGGVSKAIVSEIVSEVTRQSVREDLDEDETIQRMAKRLQEARDSVRHGVTYDTESDAAEMDVAIFTERTGPKGSDSWAAVVHSFVTRYDDHRLLSERLDTTRRGGRIVVEVEAAEGEKGTVSRRNHLDEVAVSILTGLPVRFRVRPARARRDSKWLLPRSVKSSSPW